MMRFNFVTAIAGSALLLTSLMAAPDAQALSLRLSSGPCTVTAPDGDADGLVVYNGACGDFSVNVSTGVSDPILAPPYPHMDLNSVNVASTIPGSLTILLTDDNFEGLTGALMNMIGGTIGQGADARFRLYASTTNVEFAEDILLFDSGTVGTGAFAISETNAYGFGSDPWSLTMRVDLIHREPGQVSSFDWELREVPEPTSMALLGLGLFGMGAAARRRKR